MADNLLVSVETLVTALVNREIDCSWYFELCAHSEALLLSRKACVTSGDSESST